MPAGPLKLSTYVVHVCPHNTLITPPGLFVLSSARHRSFPSTSMSLLRLAPARFLPASRLQPPSIPRQYTASTESPNWEDLNASHSTQGHRRRPRALRVPRSPPRCGRPARQTQVLKPLGSSPLSGGAHDGKAQTPSGGNRTSSKQGRGAFNSQGILGAALTTCVGLVTGTHQLARSEGANDLIEFRIQVIAGGVIYERWYKANVFYKVDVLQKSSIIP